MAGGGGCWRRLLFTVLCQLQQQQRQCHTQLWCMVQACIGSLGEPTLQLQQGSLLQQIAAAAS